MDSLLAETVFYSNIPFHIRLETLPAGFRKHFHKDFIEIVIVLGGECMHRIGEDCFRAQAGNVYVLQGETAHGFEETAPDFNICNLMYMPKGMGLPEARLRKLPGYQALFLLEPKWRRQRGFKHYLHLDARQLQHVLELARPMLKEQERAAPGWDCLASAFLIDLIIFLSRAYAADVKQSSRLLPLAAAVAHLETNFRDKIVLKDLAEMAHMSRRTLFRAFDEAFGQTPLAYMTHLRLREACRLLLEQANMTVGEVAAACGFEDSNYFSRCFRLQQGCSPREYRSRPWVKGGRSS